jgi:hypothetical protein
MFALRTFSWPSSALFVFFVVGLVTGQDSTPAFQQLKHLIRPHLGNSLAGGKTIRMSALLNSAPQLEMSRVDQIAALPLGGRVRLDPWSNRVELVKTKPVTLLSAREKMPFEVTPFFPYLTRLQAVTADKIAVAPSRQQESGTIPAASQE